MTFCNGTENVFNGITFSLRISEETLWEGGPRHRKVLCTRIYYEFPI